MFVPPGQGKDWGVQHTVSEYLEGVHLLPGKRRKLLRKLGALERR